MGMLAFRDFAEADVFAVYEETAGGGAFNDIDAPRNAPAKTPASHLDKIYIHSALDLMEIAAEATVTINHASVSAGGSISGNAGQSQVFSWAGATADHLLLDISSLGLTEAPIVLVAAGNNIVWPGMPVQTESGGRARYVTAYSTATAVRLWESASRTSSALSATSIAYTVLVFAPQRTSLNGIAAGFASSTGEFQAARSRLSTLRRFLQVSTAGSPFGLPLGRTLDLDDGAPRAWRADGTTYDPVPAGVTVTVSPGTGSASSLLDYSGSFTGSDTLLVQAPGGGTGPMGFEVDAASGKMKFRGGGADTLVVPDSIPVLLLPTQVALSAQLAAFADVGKGRMYTHQWFMNRPPASYSGNETGRCFVTALPGESQSTTTLQAAPALTDIFVGQIKLSRTVSPSHNWLGSAINKLVPENVWISVVGGTSFLLEAHLGFARAMSIYMDAGNLVLHKQQSVGPSPGGYGGFGTGYGAFSNPGNFSVSGGETVSGATDGYPVYYPGDTGAPHYKSRFYPIEEADPFGAAVWVPPTSYRRTGSDPPSISDPTNYASTWQFDLRGQFGRRS